MQSLVRMERLAAAAAAAVSSASTAAAAAVGTAGDSSPAAAASAPASTTAEGFVLNLPPGFHFLPTDAELILDYLRRRLAGLKSPLPIFIDEHVMDYHPEKLIEKHRNYGEDRWFFFTTRKPKFAKGNRPNRATLGNNGHWNASGRVRPVVTGKGALVGCVRTLVFYEASRRKKKKNKEVVEAIAPAPEEGEVAPVADGLKTDWAMYEYESLESEAEFEARLKNGHCNMDVLVLCVIKKKKHCEESKKKTQEKGTKSRKRKQELDEAHEEFVKRTPMATPPPQELVEAPLEVDGGSTTPNTNVSTPPVLTAALSQEMMIVPAEGDSIHNAYDDPIVGMQPPLFNPLMKSADVPTPQEHFSHVQSSWYRQQPQQKIQLKAMASFSQVYGNTMVSSQVYRNTTMAPPPVHGYDFGPDLPNYGYSNMYLSRTTNIMDSHHDLSSIHVKFPSQPSYGVGSSSSGTQGAMVLRSTEYSASVLTSKY
ncbi:hypothetical protein ACP4OV_012473 [Aristida adscensionis]